MLAKSTSCLIGISLAIQASEILGCTRRSFRNAALARSSGPAMAAAAASTRWAPTKSPPLPDAFARKTHRLVIVAANEVGVSGDAVIDRRERIARAQPQRTPRGQVGFFPAPAIG
jgi:hypothetical protein